jgi:hypothetical protein
MVLGAGISGAIFTTVMAHESSGIISAGSPVPATAFYTALGASFLVVSMITILGVVTSLVRVNTNS